MSYPELYSDERIVLQASNVKVKAVSFEIVLTTRRLVLIDSKKGSIPPQEINLATLRDVESGENAIRDPTITISIITISGNTRQMVLTFSKISGGERRREADEWVRALRQNITTTVYHPVTAPAPREPQPAPAVQPPALPATPIPEAPLPAEQPPAPPAEKAEIAAAPPPKKRIELARPIKKIVEPEPVMPVPVETTSLPTGSFCNRCGNRIPTDSVFCNRCGTPVVSDTESGFAATEIAVPPVAPAVPQIQLTPPPTPHEPSEKKERPIEEVIHSIEPLIEDSVPRTAPAPLVPAKQVYHIPSPQPHEEVPEPVMPAAPGESAASEATPGVQWPVLSKTGTPADSATAAAAPVPAPESPPAQTPPPPAPARRSGLFTIAILALVILAVLAGAFILLTPGGEPGSGTMTITQTPVATTPPVTTVPTQQTTVPVVTTPQTTTPALTVPSTGVWVLVTYAGRFSGSVGTPGNLKVISDSGSHLYQVPTVDGPVVVAIQKDDGSSAVLSVEVYKNGELMKHSQTAAPKGIIEMQTIFKISVTANTTT